MKLADKPIPEIGIQSRTQRISVSVKSFSLNLLSKPANFLVVWSEWLFSPPTAFSHRLYLSVSSATQLVIEIFAWIFKEIDFLKLEKRTAKEVLLAVFKNQFALRRTEYFRCESGYRGWLLKKVLDFCEIRWFSPEEWSKKHTLSPSQKENSRSARTHVFLTLYIMQNTT